MNPLWHFAMLSESLYRSDDAQLSLREWLEDIVEPLWRAADQRDLSLDIKPVHEPDLGLSLDHVGALVADSVSACSEMLHTQGYWDIETRPSVVMADLIGIPIDIVQSHAAPSHMAPKGRRVEFFCPRTRGLAESKLELVRNWGRLGHGVHVGFAAPSREKMFEAVKALARGSFIAPRWYQHIKRRAADPVPPGDPNLLVKWEQPSEPSLCYLDGFVGSQRIRVEVGVCPC